SRIVRADDERRVPLPAAERAASTSAATAAASRRCRRQLSADDVLRARLDALADAGPQIEPREAAALRLRVDVVRVLRIDAAPEAVAAADVVPVARADAGAAVERARRSADRSVVLGAAADVVEGQRVVGRDAVELRQRQVGEVVERLHAVPRLVESAVVAD